MDLGLQKNVALDFDGTLAALPDALKTEGFGVLTRIDVHDTLKQKIGVDFQRYTILGACNPAIAHRALSHHLGFGLMMPCNVVLHAGPGGTTVVQAVDPLRTQAPQVSTELAKLAEEVRDKLQRVLDRLPAVK